MGWFWSNTASARTASSHTEDSSQQIPSSSSSPSSSPSSQQATPSPSQPPPASPSSQPYDDSPENDPELHKFMAMFSASGNETATALEEAQKQPSSDAPSKLAAWKAAWSSSGSSSAATSSDTPEYVHRERSLAEATLPVTMSCRQAFDLAWACQSPAGQWRAVYRHGSVRPCSEMWDDFWFCMRVKGFSEGPMKEEAIREHYRKKEMDKYYAPGRLSSEDVWRSRTVDEVLPPGAVFQQNFQVVVGNKAGDGDSTNSAPNGYVDDSREDASQILADAERRRRIRQQMGYNN